MWATDGSFQVIVPAKWILAGEHSVLRGKRAIAFPYSKFFLSLDYNPKGNGIKFTYPEYEDQIRVLFQRAYDWLKERNFILKAQSIQSDLIGGSLVIKTSIPAKAGLGSSAALCVGLAKFAFWKFAREFESSDAVIALATHLEDEFHGKSSGLDVHTVFHNKPIVFSMHQSGQPLKLGLIPKFKLIDSGLRGSTKECIIRVQNWRDQNPKKRDEIDHLMSEAAERSIEALMHYQSHTVNGDRVIAAAMTQAQSCFEAWGLVPDALLKQKEEILKKGALAVKLTGAGLGGFWVALYKT